MVASLGYMMTFFSLCRGGLWLSGRFVQLFRSDVKRIARRQAHESLLDVVGVIHREFKRPAHLTGRRVQGEKRARKSVHHMGSEDAAVHLWKRNEPLGADRNH